MSDYGAVYLIERDRARELGREVERLQRSLDQADRLLRNAEDEVKDLRETLTAVLDQVESCCSRSGLCVDVTAARNRLGKGA